MAPADDNRADTAGWAEAFRESRDREAFGHLYLAERRSVFAVCLKYLREPDLGEEACHEAFSRAWERWHTYRGGDFGAWVRTIAARHCLDLLRHRQVESALPPDPDRGSPQPRSEAIGREELARARMIVTGLEERQRRVFLLRHLDGLSYAQIAEETGLEPEAVRSSLQNARRNFRLAWEAAATRAGERHD